MATDSWGSAPAFTGATLDSVHEALGIPQFSGAAGNDWYLPFNGLIIQGGQVTVPAGATVVPLVTAFQQQVLGVFLQSQTAGLASQVTATTLANFTVTHVGANCTHFWWAIGV